MATHLALAPVAHDVPVDRWQAAIAEWSQRIFHALKRVAQRKFLVCVALAVLPVAMRLALLRAVAAPSPTVHDEFSYLLAADTFRAGRVTNPTPPMWEHFETYHEIMRPTYQSKYPPAQGLVIALGWKAFGRPWAGVLISFALMCGCLCWMLQGWMPPVYALLGTLVAIGQLGIFSYWMDSYWGGAVAAAGGALLLGALPRLLRSPSVTSAALGAFGTVLLANSRPYEGLVLVASAAVALVWWARRRGRFATLFSPRNLVPLILVGSCGAAWMAYYDYRVTGSPWKMPYAVYQETYMVVPQWFILPPNPHPPAFRHAELRNQWTEVEVPEYKALRHNPMRAVLKELHDVLPFYCSMLVFCAIAAAFLLGRSIKLRLALGILVPLWCAMLVETWRFPHYIAGGTGLIFVMAMYGTRILRARSARMGAAFVLLFAAVPFVQGLSKAVDAYRSDEDAQPRSVTETKILSLGGKHLVIVHYDPDHPVYRDWVFNAADIDTAPIVWARDMGPAKNHELIDYYHDRTVWLAHPDPPFSLTRYVP